MNDALAPRLRFGQYKGVPLHQVPSDYLQWVSKLPDLWPAQRAAVEAGLAAPAGFDFPTRRLAEVRACSVGSSTQRRSRIRTAEPVTLRQLSEVFDGKTAGAQAVQKPELRL
jgi:hypothetical protein